MKENALIRKYNVSGPRYTSYPTVPYWSETGFNVDAWKESVKRGFKEHAQEGLSLYIHLPFCESLCTFCGCFKRITKNHAVEKTYIEALLKEWRLYCALFGERPRVRELHLGGGTPTFFSTQNLEDLVNGLFAFAEKTADFSMGFEAHPGNTTHNHLRTLHALGFRRISFGVQDYAETVQKAINRFQTFEQVSDITRTAREIGFTSVGHDLVYGLPFQTVDDVVDTIEKTLALRPDRIAFYGYAHVPWIKGNGQRGFKEEDIPKDQRKRQLYQTGKDMLMGHGYFEIGMDHFAIATDALYKASRDGALHRNFMGYTEATTGLMIGLGVSAIGDSGYAFAQNTKSFEDYYQMLEWDTLPVVKGHLLTEEDRIVRRHILDLMCRFATSAQNHPFMPQILERLKVLQRDGLVVVDEEKIAVTQKGRPFVRNVCMAFDLHLHAHSGRERLFSSTV